MDEPRFLKMRIWQESHALLLAVYKFSASFPSDEQYGVSSQLRRSSASVGANIAEGAGRRTVDDFARHLAIAKGSAYEAMQFLLAARDLGFGNGQVADELIIRYRGLAVGIQQYSVALRNKKQRE